MGAHANSVHEIVSASIRYAATGTICAHALQQMTRAHTHHSHAHTGAHTQTHKHTNTHTHTHALAHTNTYSPPSLSPLQTFQTGGGHCLLVLCFIGYVSLLVHGIAGVLLPHSSSISLPMRNYSYAVAYVLECIHGVEHQEPRRSTIPAACSRLHVSQYSKFPVLRNRRFGPRRLFLIVLGLATAQG